MTSPPPLSLNDSYLFFSLSGGCPEDLRRVQVPPPPIYIYNNTNTDGVLLWLLNVSPVAGRPGANYSSVGTITSKPSDVRT